MQAVFDCAVGRVTTAPQCEVCKGQASSFGLTEADTLACSECFGRCDICGAEVVMPHATRGCAATTR